MIGLSHVIGGVSYDRPLSHDKGGSHMIGLSRVIGGVSHMVGLSAGRGGSHMIGLSFHTDAEVKK